MENVVLKVSGSLKYIFSELCGFSEEVEAQISSNHHEIDPTSLQEDNYQKDLEGRI